MSKKSRNSKKAPESISKKKIGQIHEALRDMHTLMGPRPKDGRSVTINKTQVEPGLDMPELPDQLIKPEEHLDTGKLNVVLLGETGAGKTLLAQVITGLKREDEAVLPDNLLTNTAWSVHLVFSKEPNPSVRVTGEDGTPTEISREEYIQEAACGKESRKPWSSVEIEIESSDLPTEIVLIDTPGLNAARGLNAAEKDEELTNAVLPTAHAIVCVSICDPPMTASKAKAFVSQFGPRADSSVKHLFFVFNDKLGMSDNQKSEVKSHIDDTLKPYFGRGKEFNKALYDSRVFCFNAKTARTHQLSHGSVENDLVKLLDQCGYQPFHNSLRKLPEDHRPLELDNIIRAVEPEYDRAVCVKIPEAMRVSALPLEKLDGELRDLEDAMPRWEKKQEHAVNLFTRWREERRQVTETEVRKWFMNEVEGEWKRNWNEAMGGAPDYLRARIRRDNRASVERDIIGRVRDQLQKRFATWVDGPLEQILQDVDSEHYDGVVYAFEHYLEDLDDTLQQAEDLLSTIRTQILNKIRIPAADLSDVISKSFECSSRNPIFTAMGDRFSRMWRYWDDEQRMFQARVDDELGKALRDEAKKIVDALGKQTVAALNEPESKTALEIKALLASVVADRRTLLRCGRERHPEVTKDAKSEEDRLKKIKTLLESRFKVVLSGLSD